MSRSSCIRCGLAVLVLVLAVTLASGCAPPPMTAGEYYAGTWIFREHEVLYRESFRGVRGDFEGEFFGAFFVASGSIEGSFGTETMIEFAWERRPGERIVTTLPISKFIFLTDETKAIPTVEFRFNMDWTRQELIGWYERWIASREEIEEGNPNYYLMSGEDSQRNFYGLNTAIVRISSAALEKEIYLPK